MWRVRLEAWAVRAGELRALLAPEELARADRRRSPDDRDRLVASRAALRVLAARYLRSDPREVRLAAGPGGKPAVVAPAPLELNLSHSGELALCAFASGGAVGVDVERVRPGFDDLAARFFAPAEAARVAAAAPADRAGEFFRLWTLKEAFVKGTGRGLALPLREFEVVPGAGGATASIRSADHAALAAPWRLASFVPAPGYQAALAVGGPADAVRFWSADTDEECPAG